MAEFIKRWDCGGNYPKGYVGRHDKTYFVAFAVNERMWCTEAFSTFPIERLKQMHMQGLAPAVAHMINC